MKKQVDLKVEPLDITHLEKAWEDYRGDGFTDIGKLNLVAWMGERMGRVLQEIRILRTQVEGLQAMLEEERQKGQEATFDHMFDKEW